jgi:hypothetical protein
MQVFRKMDDEEWDKVRKQIWKIDKQDRVLDKIVARRKKKRSFEYEVSNAGVSHVLWACGRRAM